MDAKKLHQFESTMPSCKFIFGNGKVANFVNGVYRTDFPGEVAELQAEVKHGSNYFSYRGEVSADDLDPLAAIKRKGVEEYLAAQKAQADPKRNMGNTANTGIMGSAATSGTVAAVAEGSSVKAVGAASAIKLNTGK